MSRYAPVVPIQIAEQLQSPSVANDIFGDYHLLLAHDILDKPEDYKRVYGIVRERWSGSFIILDNSIVELGTAMGIDALMDAADIIQPDCIVIPDIMGKGKETRELSKVFCNNYSRYIRERKIAYPIKLMGVLQGTDVEDCLETYRWYCGLDHVGHIGVPRVIAQEQGSRMPLMVQLSMRSAFSNIHLLGFSDNLLDDVSCARMPIVRGIDSAVPVRAGMNLQSLTLNTPSDYGKRGDYWERTIVGEAQAIEVAYNIRNMREWINSDY